MTILDILSVCNIAACPGRFRQAMSILLPLECAFDPDHVTIRMENVPGDAGGLTFAGLDEATWRPLGFPYQDPTPQAVVSAYETEWNRLRACELPNPLGAVLFVQGTNQGDERCEAMLQDAINDFNVPSGKIAVDGKIGPETVRAAWKISTLDLARAFLAKSKARYAAIIRRTPRDAKFEKGWMNRITAIERFFELGFDSAPMS